MCQDNRKGSNSSLYPSLLYLGRGNEVVGGQRAGVEEITKEIGKKWNVVAEA